MASDVRPQVFKMAGTWLWNCTGGACRSGPVGDNFPAVAWRDPWTAALASATKHAVLYHNPDEGEEIR